MTEQEVIRLVVKKLVEMRSNDPFWPDDPVLAAAYVVNESGALLDESIHWSELVGYDALHDHQREQCILEAIRIAAVAMRWLMNAHTYEVVSSRMPEKNLGSAGDNAVNGNGKGDS